MKFLITVCLLTATTTIVAQNDGRKELKACAKEYLESRNLTLKCESVVNNFEKYLIHVVAGREEGAIENCVNKKFKDYQFLEFFLHLEIDDLREDPTLKTFDYMSPISGAPRRLCRRSYFSDDELENRLNSFKKFRGDTEYQCSYKYFLQKKFIEKSDFGFDTSDFDSINCTSYFEEFEDELEKSQPQEDLLWKYAQCAERKQTEYNFERNWELLKAIGMFGLSDLQKKKYKEMMMKWYSSADQFILECIRDAYKGT